MASPYTNYSLSQISVRLDGEADRVQATEEAAEHASGEHGSSTEDDVCEGARQEGDRGIEEAWDPHRMTPGTSPCCAIA